jgi:hypothetical protein
MKKVSFFYTLLLILGLSSAWGQESRIAKINPEDPTFRAKYSQLSFNGKFYILAVKDDVNNYYMADFTQFPEKFERVYFLNQVYKSGKIVNIDGDISQERVWFLSNKKFTEQETGETFDQLKDLTLKAASAMTTQEKESWMLKNNKFR